MVRTLKDYGGAEARSGFITRATFTPLMVNLLYAVKCHAAFSIFDSSGDGRVNFTEFQDGYPHPFLTRNYNQISPTFSHQTRVPRRVPHSRRNRSRNA